MIMGALTLTGMYMNRVQEKQSPEESIGFHEDWSGDFVEVPDGTLLDEFQVVDSGTVKNPGITSETATTETSDENSEQQSVTRKPASKTSNNLTKGEIPSEEVTKAAMSEFVEAMTLSFNGLSLPENFVSEDKILLPYSMDKAVYFQTLDQYKYNPAMIIAAEIDAPVYTLSAGRIVDKYWDHETGWTLEMDLGGGFKAYYGQLNNDTLEKEVDTYVAAGDVLGYVDVPTKYYSEEGSNIYFAMTRNGKPVDPMEYVTGE
jgi:murein DD-endopeptidase MepM/ murein hydrolase activator NlpD